MNRYAVSMKLRNLAGRHLIKLSVEANNVKTKDKEIKFGWRAYAAAARRDPGPGA